MYWSADCLACTMLIIFKDGFRAGENMNTMAMPATRTTPVIRITNAKVGNLVLEVDIAKH